MTDPLNTLIHLTSQLSDLNMIQEWIDHARVAVPDNHQVQMELDRRQIQLDHDRAAIELMMAGIASTN